jgi:hypothetical protein
MVDAMRLLRINIGTSGPTSTAPPTSSPSDGGGGGKGPSTSTSTSASATPSLTVGETDVIRGLDEADMQFIKDKLVSHGSDRFRQNVSLHHPTLWSKERENGGYSRLEIRNV